jgi:hypothetical protein
MAIVATPIERRLITRKSLFIMPPAENTAALPAKNGSVSFDP